MSRDKMSDEELRAFAISKVASLAANKDGIYSITKVIADSVIIMEFIRKGKIGNLKVVEDYDGCAEEA